ncbi:MAG: hypothetical protein COB79_04785 [Zetaproteobacteria bacterium]|nr:MAG: hypothetical protein COB79_04785 [Zetaproteobacteria bacterium]
MIMIFQELEFIYKARTCHKDWSMRLEALANGLPVETKNTREIEVSCFIEDVKEFSADIISCPCFSEFNLLYIDVHGTINQLTKTIDGIGKADAKLLVPKLKRLVVYFDELELWLKNQARKSDVTRAEPMKKKSPAASDALASGSLLHKVAQKKGKKKESSDKYEDIMDDLEQSIRELDDIL